ncbi:MAG TPA: hypothetical protein VIL86_04860, partial [Tepidisphaeraceae bacterium]
MHADRNDIYLTNEIADWIDAAQVEVDMIGGWRMAPGRCPYLNRKTAVDFDQATRNIVSAIATRFHTIDQKPIAELARIIRKWHTDESANKLPEQVTIEAIHDDALIQVSAMLDVVRTQYTYTDPAHPLFNAERIAEALDKRAAAMEKDTAGKHNAAFILAEIGGIFSGAIPAGGLDGPALAPLKKILESIDHDQQARGRAVVDWMTSKGMTPAKIERDKLLGGIASALKSIKRPGDEVSRILEQTMPGAPQSQIVGQLATRSTPPIGKTATDRLYYPSDLMTELDVGANTLNKFVKLAGVIPPARGRKDRRYSEDERRKIFNTIVHQCPTEHTRN